MPDEVKIYLKVNYGWCVSVDGYEEYDGLEDRATALEIAKKFGSDVRDGVPVHVDDTATTAPVASAASASPAANLSIPPSMESAMSAMLIQIQLTGTLTTQYGEGGDNPIAQWNASMFLPIDEPLQFPSSPQAFSNILLAIAPALALIGPTTPAT